jgi:ABC-type polysaccharide/polyol phosphate export permease
MFKRLFGFFNQWGELISELTKREIKARYKQSVLGYAWVILVPIMNLTVMTIVFSYLVKIPTGTIPYPLYLFTALVPWTFTSSAVAAATASLMGNASLITKIKIPREIFPLSSILVKMVDLGLSTIVLMIMMIIYHAPFYPTLIWVPVIFFVQFIMVNGVSLILSATNVFYRDVENVLGVFLLVWMYLTPIIYPPEMIPPQYRPIFALNPMTGIVNAYRNVILYGVNPPWPSFSYAIVISVVLFVLGLIYFKRVQRYFADVI